jgi:CRP-like cAMP-binding protein
MEADLYFMLNRQRERELDAMVRRRLVVAERAAMTPAAPTRHERLAGALAHLARRARTVRQTPTLAPACCPA